MKAIMMSIRPKWIAKILNGEKTIEIRKHFPIDYVGWVYIYCTKGKPTLKGLIAKSWYGLGGYFDYEKLNGKVVARFWCDKVEEIKLNLVMRYSTDSMKEEELLKRSCLTVDEIDNYLWSNICCGKAIQITNLEIFDKPKEISEFKSANKYEAFINIVRVYRVYKPLTRAPQSWCYIEI